MRGKHLSEQNRKDYWQFVKELVCVLTDFRTQELSTCFQGRIKLYNFSGIDPYRRALNLLNKLAGESAWLDSQSDFSLLVGSRGGRRRVWETRSRVSGFQTSVFATPNHHPFQTVFYNTLAWIITADQNFSNRRFAVERGHFDEIETFNRSMPVVPKKKIIKIFWGNTGT